MTVRSEEPYAVRPSSMMVKRTATPRRGRRTLLLLWNLSITAMWRERFQVTRKAVKVEKWTKHFEAGVNWKELDDAGDRAGLAKSGGNEGVEIEAACCESHPPPPPAGLSSLPTSRDERDAESGLQLHARLTHAKGATTLTG